MSGDDLLTITEAAAYAGLLPSSIRTYAVDGVIPSLVQDRRRLIRRADVDEYVRTRKGRVGRPADERIGRRPATPAPAPIEVAL